MAVVLGNLAVLGEQPAADVDSGMDFITLLQDVRRQFTVKIQREAGKRLTRYKLLALNMIVVNRV